MSPKARQTEGPGRRATGVQGACAVLPLPRPGSAHPRTHGGTCWETTLTRLICR